MGLSSPRITGQAQILKPPLEYNSRYLQGIRIALKVFSMFVGGNRRWVPLKDTFGSFLGIMWSNNQEYPTEPLDKIPARQAEFELAEKKKTLAS